MIRLHELMTKSTRKLQDGVVGYTHWDLVETAFVEQRVTYGLVCRCPSTFWEEKGLWSLVK